MAADATVSIGTDLGAIRRELAKLPNLSGEAAQQTLIKVEKAVQKAEAAAKKAAKAVEKAGKEAEKAADKSLDSAGEGLKSVYELGGGSGDVVDKLGKAFAALSSPVGLVAVGIGAATLAVAGFVSGVTSAVLAADDLAKELEPLKNLEGFGVSAAALASIEHANDAVSTLATIWKQVVVVLGAEFAPVVDKVATLLVKLGLMALDAFTAFSDGHDVLRELAVFLVKQLVEAFIAPVDALMNLLWVAGKAAGMLGADGLAKSLLTVTDAYDEFTRGIAENAVDFWFDKASDAVDRLDKETADYDERAQALIGTVGKLADGQDKATKKTEGLTESFKKFLSVVDFLIEAEKNIKANAALVEMFDAVDAVAPQTIDRLRDLHDQVDSVVPKSALDALTRMQLLLLDLEHAAKLAGGQNDILNDDIKRLKSAIRAADPALESLVKSTDKLLSADTTTLKQLKDQLAELKEQAAGSDEAMKALSPSVEKVGEAVEDVRRENFERLKKTVEDVANAIVAAAEFMGEAVGAALDAADTITGGAISNLSLDSLIAAAGSGDVDFVSEAIEAGLAFLQAVVENLPELIDQLVAGLPALIQGIVDAIPGIVQAIADAIPVLVQTLVDALPDVVQAIVDALPVIVQALADSVPGLVQTIVQNLPTLVMGIIDALPVLINALIESIPTLVGGLLNALPDIIEHLVGALREIIPALIGMIPDLIIAIIQAIPDIVDAVIDAIPQIVFMLIEAIFTELLPRIPEIIWELTKALGEMIWDLLQNVVDFFKDVIAEITSLGTKETATFGDTPGPVRAGLSGLTARFAPGDVVAAARTKEGVANQVGASTKQASAPSRVQLDLADGHIAFDRLFKRNVRAGGTLATLTAGNTGQRGVYR